jgi:hypothetical protein
MEQQVVVPAPMPTVKSIWLHPEGTSQPYMHIVDGACECQTCISKIRRIILPYAA